MLSLHKLGIEQFDDTFYNECLDAAVHHVLRDLKQHARIPVPGACTLVGIADVHRQLKHDEIFACYKHLDSNKIVYLEGPVLVSRSPTIHPGDVSVYSLSWRFVGHTEFILGANRQCNWKASTWILL